MIRPSTWLRSRNAGMRSASGILVSIRLTFTEVDRQFDSVDGLGNDGQMRQGIVHAQQDDPDIVPPAHGLAVGRLRFLAPAQGLVVQTVDRFLHPLADLRADRIGHIQDA